MPDKDWTCACGASNEAFRANCRQCGKEWSPDRPSPPGENFSGGPWAPAAGPSRGVVVSGVDIPFWDLVVFFVKAGVAAVPATLILALIWGVAAALFGGCLRF